VAKVRLNPILEQLRGQVGDLVFRRYGDQVVVARKPDVSEREWSEAQIAHRERFRQATIYGRMVMADAEARALYEEAARVKGKPLFSLMVADFFNAPSIEEVDLSGYAGGVGDVIVVVAHDDFAVAGVDVSLAGGDGNPIESGAAVETPPGSGRWVYTATAAVETGATVRIAVAARDRPGSVARVEEERVV
jgi:hypothetical protein